MKRASLIARFVAFLIDTAFLFCVSLLLVAVGCAGFMLGTDRIAPRSGLTGTLLLLILVFLAIKVFLFLFYFTYLTAHGERTIGKSILGLKVVRRTDEEAIGYGRSLVRACGYWISAFPLFLGFLMAILLKGRTLHDLLAGTMVVKEG